MELEPTGLLGPPVPENGADPRNALPSHCPALLKAREGRLPGGVGPIS
jgi:hypothetical protein